MTGVKLSAPDLAGYALKTMWLRRRALLGLCAPALLVIVAAAVVGRILYPADIEGELQNAYMLLALASLIASVALVPSFTGWHRLLITGDMDRGNGRGPYGWDRREWRYFTILLGIWCLMLATNIVANLILSMAPSTATGLVALIVIIAGYLTIWANLGLGLPAAALDDQRRIGEILLLAKGNFGQIALALAGVWIMLLLTGGVAVMLAGTALIALGSVYLFFVLAMLIYYVGLVGSVGVLSRAYDLINRPDPAK